MTAESPLVGVAVSDCQLPVSQAVADVTRRRGPAGAGNLKIGRIYHAGNPPEYNRETHTFPDGYPISRVAAECARSAHRQPTAKPPITRGLRVGERLVMDSRCRACPPARAAPA